MDYRQISQDLTWCMHAPSLLRGPAFDYLNSLQARLAQYPQAARANFEPAPRLGHYYEQLWEHLLSQRLGWTPVAVNRQISEQGRTLGALDLLHYDAQNNTYVHTELAAKLYLCQHTGDSLAHFIGPNAIDRLDIKTERLLGHQLPLAQQPQAQAHIDHWLAAKRLPARTEANWQSQALVQGWLFYADESNALNAQKLPQHPMINPGHLRGRWQHVSQCNGQDYDQWLILPRQYWLSGACIGARECLRADALGHWPPAQLTQPLLLDSKAFAAILGRHSQIEKPQPLLVAGVYLESGNWCEGQRRMLVADNWPYASTRSALPPRSK
ncbi:DUF1853 family protein [Simiduia sp. 21SJ11W-1]|uniref:DUF1853 family protein n=1 Tax=Simiduia sp. 21SJ11W-1 TaxID=2909669 RepID=UPI0020A0B33C|nr:DUF1853 family protein [Simiduia sp. 21SJ11W-1]UTA49344.1 DUF1853 family protein [Simiduia sp. 21SJ11W-1]